MQIPRLDLVAVLQLDVEVTEHAALRGVALEERLKYRGGLYNGEGATFGNDDRRFLFAGRVEYNSAGEVEFFEDFVWEVAASFAISVEVSEAWA